MTLDELKSRQVTPKFIADAVNAAKKYDPTFKAPEAAAQAKIAGAPSNQQFFGNTDSLLIHGGTLDQLLEAGNHISQDDWQILNKTKNWADLTTSGITAAVNASVAKFGGTPQEASIISAALSVGLGAYLAEVSETSLSNDPNAILVLQALGSAISTAAANATPKG